MAVRKKVLIGWQEWCALPDLGLPAVKAKIDTGAKTSALHAYGIHIFEENGQRYVRFKVHPLQKTKKVVKECIAPLVDERIVISSNGERERRPVIMTQITCGPKTIMAELTLTSRHKMSFRMLLGRAALKKARFAVDPGKSFLHGKIENKSELYSPAGV